MLSPPPSAAWLTLVLPRVALHDIVCLLFLGICKYKRLPSVPCVHVSWCLSKTEWVHFGLVGLHIVHGP